MNLALEIALQRQKSRHTEKLGLKDEKQYVKAVSLASTLLESAQTKQYNDLCLDAIGFFEQRSDDTVDLPADSTERAGIEAALGLLKQYKVNDDASNDDIRDKTLLLADKLGELFDDRENGDDIKLFADKFIEGMREFHNQLEGGDQEETGSDDVGNEPESDDTKPEGEQGMPGEEQDAQPGEEFQHDLEQEVEPYDASQHGRRAPDHLQRRVKSESAYDQMAKLNGLFTEGRLLSRGFTRQQVGRAISAGLFERNVSTGMLRSIPNYLRIRKLSGLNETDPTQNYVQGQFQPGQSYQHIKDGQTRNLQVLRVDNGKPVFIDPNDSNKGEITDVDQKEVSPTPLDKDGKPAAPANSNTPTPSNPPAPGLGEARGWGRGGVARFARLFE